MGHFQVRKLLVYQRVIIHSRNPTWLAGLYIYISIYYYLLFTIIIYYYLLNYKRVQLKCLSVAFQGFRDPILEYLECGRPGRVIWPLPSRHWKARRDIYHINNIYICIYIYIATPSHRQKSWRPGILWWGTSSFLHFEDLNRKITDWKWEI